jgi:hypothetical protein
VGSNAQNPGVAQLRIPSASTPFLNGESVSLSWYVQLHKIAQAFSGMQLPSSPFAGLPAGPSLGQIAWVTDSATNTVGSIVSSGTLPTLYPVLCWFNGADWTVISTFGSPAAVWVSVVSAALAAGAWHVGSVTFADLPPVTGNGGSIRVVTDATTNTPGQILTVGGGAFTVLAFCDPLAYNSATKTNGWWRVIGL